MLDRLIAIVLTATLALPAIVAPPCCCETLAATCVLDDCVLDDLASALPPCCRNGASPANNPQPVTCGCEGCLAAKPASPLAATAAAPRAGDLDDLPLAFGAGPQDPLPSLASAPALPALSAASLDRPPPDLHAWFCVWVI